MALNVTFRKVIVKHLIALNKQQRYIKGRRQASPAVFLIAGSNASDESAYRRQVFCEVRRSRACDALCRGLVDALP